MNISFTVSHANGAGTVNLQLLQLLLLLLGVTLQLLMPLRQKVKAWSSAL